MLQLGDGIRRPHVVLTAQAEGIVTADIQVMAVDGCVTKGIYMPAQGLRSDLLQTNALDRGRGAAEPGVDKLAAEANGIKDLCAAIGLVGRDTHFRHHLEQSFANCLDVAFLHFVRTQLLGQLSADRFQGFEGQVGIDGLRPVTGQGGKMMHFACGTGFHHQTRVGTQTGAHQMVVHGRSGQQGRDGDIVRIHDAVRQDQDVVTSLDRFLSLPAERFQGIFHARRALDIRVTDVQGLGTEGAVGVLLDVADAFDVTIGEYRLIYLQAHVFAGRFRSQQIRARPDQRNQGHDQFFTDRIDRRVGHLGEVLFEVV